MPWEINNTTALFLGEHSDVPFTAHSVAIGDETNAESDGAIAIGYNARAADTGDVAVGGMASATGGLSVSVGEGANSSGLGVVIGWQMGYMTRERGVAIGRQFGSNVPTDENKDVSSVRIGFGNLVAPLPGHKRCTGVSVGRSVAGMIPESEAGPSTTVCGPSDLNGAHSTAIGDACNVAGENRNTVIGHSVLMQAHGTGTTSMGTNSCRRAGVSQAQQLSEIYGPEVQRYLDRRIAQNEPEQAATPTPRLDEVTSIGMSSGYMNGSSDTTLVGCNTGEYYCKPGVVAVGFCGAQFSSGENMVSVTAGKPRWQYYGKNFNQGEHAVYISRENPHEIQSRSVTVSASEPPKDSVTDGCVIEPIRHDPIATGGQQLMYDPVTGVVYRKTLI